MHIEMIATEQIKPAKYNPRKDLKPTDPEYQQLRRSIDEFDCIQPLVWNQQSGNLVAGHQRFKILKARGDRQVPCVIVNLSPEKEKALNLGLNKIGGSWDEKDLLKYWMS